MSLSSGSIFRRNLRMQKSGPDTLHPKPSQPHARLEVGAARVHRKYAEACITVSDLLSWRFETFSVEREWKIATRKEGGPATYSSYT